MRSFEHWMRQVLPPYSVCLLALAPVVGAFLLEWLVVRRIYGEWMNPLAIKEELDVHMHQGIVAGIACAYGVWRVAGFHPFFRPKYREWLKTVAWDPSQPLPLGSPTLAWQDGVILLAMGVIAGDWQWGLVNGAAMLGGWSVMLIAANFASQFDWLSLLGALALLPAALSEHFPWLGAAMLPAYLISAWGVKPSLQLFPWEKMPRWDAMHSTRVEQVGRPSDSWPLLRTEHSGDIAVGIAIGSALKFATFAGAGAATFVVVANLDAIERGGYSATSFQPAAILSLLMACIRLWIYCGACRPPISLAGRIATGRLVIPGYDQVFVAPLLVLLIGIGAPTVLWRLGLSEPLAAGITMFATFAVGLGMGPNLERWHMTGNHRIVVRRPAGSKQFAKSRGAA